MDHRPDHHSVLLLRREQLGRKRLRQWLRRQQRLRRLLLTEHDIRRRGPSERSCLGRAEGTESHWKNIEDLMERRRSSGASPALSRRRV